MYVGVDLGGTKIAVAVVDVERGTLAGQLVVPTEAHEGPPAVLQRMIQLVRAVCHAAGVPPDQLQGVGLGVPGVFDAASGHTLLLPNLPSAWVDVPVVPPLVAALGCPVILINDARAFVLGEATWGAGRGAHTVVGLTLGTGIGGGIAINGRLHLGIDGTAGEVGHMTIDPHGLLCGCGNRGCLETLASGPAITALGIRALVHGNTTSLGELGGYDPRRVTPELIGQAAAAGDPVARDILDRAADALGIGVANIVTTLSPDRVVLGGGVTHLGVWLFDAVRTVVRARCRAVPVERISIMPAALGADAGVIGAATWAAQQQLKN
ncbi:MAG: ROK family protein [Herpetosiphonaceae bacterium]|nr:ROK family protein [Herpetosiphonaceae bacterium]